LLPLLGLLGLLGLFDVLELPLLLPLAPPLGLLGEELLPLAADDGLFEALEPPAADWSRWQPASASASDAAMIISTLMCPPLEKSTTYRASIGPL
jgi:hypothetical protein